MATVVADIGGWMYNAAAGWLMTSLTSSPVMVSFVQVAASLPLFLFAMPAGALADIIEKRRFILVLEILMAVLSAVFAALLSAGWVTPELLLLFMFLVATLSALEAPAWQAIVPQLVPRQDLGTAVAANLLIANRKIKQVSAASITSPSDGAVIDGRGHVLMPGLTNAHWHMTMAVNTMQNLEQADTGLIYAHAVAERKKRSCAASPRCATWRVPPSASRRRSMAAWLRDRAFIPAARSSRRRQGTATSERPTQGQPPAAAGRPTSRRSASSPS
jgi:Transmembrane secretion effector